MARRDDEPIPTGSDTGQPARTLDLEWIVNQIAHAFRNPVFAALVQTETISMQAEQIPEARKAAGILNKQLRRLDRSLNEMLLFGRPAEAELQRLNVARLLNSVVDDYRRGQRCEPAEVSLSVDDLGREANWDPKAVRIVLERLLDNAVEHTQPPHRVELRVEADGDRHIVLCVRDEGEGIPEDILRRACLPFFPQHRGRPGLGLAIADKYVRLLGGTLVIESEPGAGTEVRVTLPRDPAAT